jgi:type III pantothenate kinase
MRWVVDVGNTESVMGLFETAVPGPDTAPLATFRYSTRHVRTADELRLLFRAFLTDAGVPAPGQAVIGSVVPAHTTQLRQVLPTLVDGPVVVIDGASPLGIKLSVDEPGTVGADRIVNTLAASRLYARDTIVVDLGTATTYDCITADGDFLGGVIAPGPQAGAAWLTGQTAKLPAVEFRPPATVIGKRTETCLHSGIFYGIVDAVDGMVARIQKAWGVPDPLVVVTGGFASLLGPHLRKADHIAPHLTLVGLALAGASMASPAARG